MKNNAARLLGQENGNERQSKTFFSELRLGLEKKEWKKVEANRLLGYNGHSERTRQRNAARARQGQKEREEAKFS